MLFRQRPRRVGLNKERACRKRRKPALSIRLARASCSGNSTRCIRSALAICDKIRQVHTLGSWHHYALTRAAVRETMTTALPFVGQLYMVQRQPPQDTPATLCCVRACVRACCMRRRLHAALRTHLAAMRISAGFFYCGKGSVPLFFFLQFPFFFFFFLFLPPPLHGTAFKPALSRSHKGGWTGVQESTTLRACISLLNSCCSCFAHMLNDGAW